MTTRRKKMQGIVTYTPKLCEEILGRSDPNFRNNLPDHARALAEDMKEGRWVLNGESIIFAPGGKKVIEGRHRMMACILSGVSFKSYTVTLPRGADVEKILPTINTGKPKRLADFLRWKGERNATELGSALRLVWRLQHGTVRTYRDAPTVTQLLNLLEDNRTLPTFITQSRRLRPLLPPSIGAGIVFLGVHGREEDEFAESFLSAVATGMELKEKHPAYVLRRALIRNVSSQAKMPTSYKAALTVLTWNAFVQRLDMQRLRWSDTGPNRSVFPSLLTIDDSGIIDGEVPTPPETP